VPALRLGIQNPIFLRMAPRALSPGLAMAMPATRSGITQAKLLVIDASLVDDDCGVATKYQVHGGVLVTLNGLAGGRTDFNL
jgi:hypothetical protein